eukprot:s333_g20.t1
MSGGKCKHAWQASQLFLDLALTTERRSVSSRKKKQRLETGVEEAPKTTKKQRAKPVFEEEPPPPASRAMGGRRPREVDLRLAVNPVSLEPVVDVLEPLEPSQQQVQFLPRLLCRSDALGLTAARLLLATDWPHPEGEKEGKRCRNRSGHRSSGIATGWHPADLRTRRGAGQDPDSGRVGGAEVAGRQEQGSAPQELREAERIGKLTRLLRPGRDPPETRWRP